MNISAADVNKLRQMTGAGMMDCKKALTEANGDFEEAVVILRKKGQKVSASRADREANEGAIITLTNSEGNFGVLVALTCETDFVAKNEEFVALARQVAELALSKKISSIELLLEEKIDGISLTEKLIEYTGKIGEKISVGKYETISGEGIITYVHSNNKLGVMVAVNQAVNDAVVAAGKDTAMQIAAMNPVAVDKDDVDPSIMSAKSKLAKTKLVKKASQKTSSKKSL